MSIPAITRRMLERLPPAWQEGPNIRTLMGTLASEIGLGEAGTVALLRSRHVGTAADWGSGDPASSELGRLGALVGLRPDPDERSRDFRIRLARFLAIHAMGLGTPDALLRLAALEYRALDEPRLDTEPGSGRRVALIKVPTRDNRVAEIRLELEDHPSRVNRTHWQMVIDEEQAIEQRGLDPERPEIRLCPQDGDVHFPMLRFRNQGVALVYAGTVPRGSELRLRHQRPAEIDGQHAPVPVFTLYGAVWDDARCDEAAFSGGSPGVVLPELPYGEHPLSWSVGEASVVEMLLGGMDPNTSWGDGQAFDDPSARFTERWDKGPGARFAGGESRISAESAQTSRPAQQLTVDLMWVGREPAAFAVYIPAGFVPRRFAKHPNPTAALAIALRGALDYGRAAGVRAHLVASLHGPVETLTFIDSLTRQVALSLPEPVAPADTLSGRLSVRIAEIASAEDRVGQVGRYDQAVLDADFFAPPRVEAMFGESLFGGAKLQPGGVGIFGAAMLGAHKFTDVPDGVFGKSTFSHADFGGRTRPQLDRFHLDEAKFPAAEGLLRFGAGHLDLTTLGTGKPMGLDRRKLGQAELSVGVPAVLAGSDPEVRRPARFDKVEFPYWKPLHLAGDRDEDGDFFDKSGFADWPSPRFALARLNYTRLGEIALASRPARRFEPARFNHTYLSEITLA